MNNFDKHSQLQQKAASTFWGYVGFQLEEANEHHVIVSLDIQDHHKNLIGIVHGGVLMSMLDNTMGLLMLLFGQNAVTATMNTHFLSNIENGKIFCKAEPLHKTKRTNTVTASIYDEHSQILAWASGAYRLMK